MRYGLNYNGTIKVNALGYKPVDGFTFELRNDQDYSFSMDMDMEEKNNTGAIGGRVVDRRTGLNIPDAHVTIRVVRNDSVFHSEVLEVSSEDGDFFHSIENLRESASYTAQLTVEARGYEYRNGSNLTFELTLDNLFRRNDIIIDLVERNATISIRGQVVNDRTGRPLSQANVLVQIEGHFDHEDFEEVSLRTDSEGFFYYRQPDIRHGYDYSGSVSVSARSYVSDTIEELRFDYDNFYEQNELVFSLEERNVTGRIEGRIVNDRTGKPLEEATVEVNIGGKVVEVKTDEDGRFSYEQEDLRHGLSYATEFYAGLTGFYSNKDLRDILSLSNEYSSENVTIRLRERNVTAEISGIIMNQRSLKPLDSAEVKIELDGKVLEVLTDNKGKIKIISKKICFFGLIFQFICLTFY